MLSTAKFQMQAPGALAWILGSSRSGSTWLLRMLSALDRVVAIDDPHLGHHLAPWRPIPLAWATADEPPDLATLADFKRERPDYLFSDEHRDVWVPALRELVARRFEAHLPADPRPDAPPIVVVKEPASQAAELFMELFPASSMIFLLRDGRDVVDSWVDAYREGSWGAEEGTYPVSEEGRLALVRWQATVWLYRTEAVERAFRRHPAARRVLVRYEELRRSPTTSLARICRMLGIEPVQGKLEEIAAEHAFEAVAPGRRGNGHEIRSAEPGAWRENLTAAEQRAMHEIMGAKLAELGYSRGPALSRAA